MPTIAPHCVISRPTHGNLPIDKSKNYPAWAAETFIANNSRRSGAGLQARVAAIELLVSQPYRFRLTISKFRALVLRRRRLFSVPLIAIILTFVIAVP
jgi:hypothetical protein